MKYLLCVDTSSKNCSVAIVSFNEKEQQKNIVDFVDNLSEEYSHSEKLTFIVEEILLKNKLELNMIKAVCLSSGPGSYTGLRIGSSVAKGICYSLNIPLISVSTLFSMSVGVFDKNKDYMYCPMIDARRMEVYTALYDNNLRTIKEPHSSIVDYNFLSSFLKDNKICFFGDGSKKIKEIINNSNAIFLEDMYPSAKNMCDLAVLKYNNRDFEDTAYYEPFYLKDFYFGK